MSFKHFKARVKTAVSAFENSGMKLVVFIDADRVTEEAQEKYCSRQERKIIQNKNGNIPFKETIMGEFFMKEGIKVYYSFRADNDDTLASHAEKDGAVVLSRDQDFFRYRNSTFKVYSGFRIKKNIIYLQESVLNSKRCIPERDLIVPPLIKEKNPSIISVLDKNFYRKGVVTPLTKQMGNPAIDLRPLRAAMYHFLGKKIDKPVLENIPYWDSKNQTVKWTEDNVYPDATFLEYLSDPLKAREIFLSKYLVRPPNIHDKIWNEHLFGINGLISEICSCCSTYSFTSLMIRLSFSKTSKIHVSTTNINAVKDNSLIA